MGKSCVVVGAGLSGLVAARALVDQGWHVTVLDKGRSVGGRMATRRIEGAIFDHGAQFFTVRDERFGRLVAEWENDGVVREWSRGFGTGRDPVDFAGFPRYIGIPMMTSIPKRLSTGLDVRTQVRANRVMVLEEGWKIDSDTGETYTADALILTPPVPQSLALLEAGGVAIQPVDQAVLDTIRYEPCLALLVVLDGPSQIPFPGAVQAESEVISWVADNQQKGISPASAALTIHASAQFSADHWNDSDDSIISLLLDAAREWFGSGVLSSELKRWRYARPLGLFSEACLVLGGHPPLILAGDAFGGPRVEGAAISGLAAADILLSWAQDQEERTAFRKSASSP